MSYGHYSIAFPPPVDVTARATELLVFVHFDDILHSNAPVLLVFLGCSSFDYRLPHWCHASLALRGLALLSGSL